MPERMKWTYWGRSINKIKIMNRLREPFIHLLKTYPLYYCWDIIEPYFDKEFRDEVVNKLFQDGFLRAPPKERAKMRKQYQLTPKGVDLAIAFVNLDHNKAMNKYSKTMEKLTRLIIFLSILTFLLGVLSLLTPLI